MNSSNALKVNFLLGIAFLVMLLAMGCTEDPIVDSQSDTLERLDVRLHELLTEQSNGLGANFYILPNSDDFDAIPQDANNPITSEKVALGQLLFHETGIALNPKKTVGMGKYSCASCHHAQGGFQACMPQGIGEGGSGFGFTGEGRIMAEEYTAEEVDVQPLRSPSALNIAYQTNVLWNGMFGATNKNEGTQASWTADTPKATNFLGYEGVETQAIAGLKVHRLKADSGLVKENVNYQALFDAAFANNPVEERITQENAGLAIAAYERTLVANEAPFQQWLKGDNQAMTDAEKTGAILFFGKGKCSNCHNGPALNDMDFYALGMKDLYEEASVLNVPLEDPAYLGRGGFTGKTSDNYKFKVPQLYNLKDSPFYGHGASFKTVKDVIAYKNEGISENANVPETALSDDFRPLYLSEQEIDYITTFIESGLRDPDLLRYVPESLPSEQCFPNNDDLSKTDLGCN